MSIKVFYRTATFNVNIIGEYYVYIYISYIYIYEISIKNQ
jgi:hypothetical protein